jgi:hypothetical protein
MARWVDQATRMMKRGGSRGPRSRLSDTRSSPCQRFPAPCQVPWAVGGCRWLESSCRARHLGAPWQSTGDGRAVRLESGDLRQRAQPRRQPPGHPPGDFRPCPDGGGRDTVRVMAGSGTHGTRPWRWRRRRGSRWSVRRYGATGRRVQGSPCPPRLLPRVDRRGLGRTVPATLPGTVGDGSDGSAGGCGKDGHDLGRSCLSSTIRHHVTNQTDSQNAGVLA